MNYIIFDTRLGYEVATLDGNHLEYRKNVLVKECKLLTAIPGRTIGAAKRVWRLHMEGLGHTEIDVLDLPEEVFNSVKGILTKESEINPKYLLAIKKFSSPIEPAIPNILINVGTRYELSEYLNKYQHGVSKSKAKVSRESILEAIATTTRVLRSHRIAMAECDGLTIHNVCKRTGGADVGHRLYTEFTTTYYVGISSWVLVRLQRRTIKYINGIPGTYVQVTLPKSLRKHRKFNTLINEFKNPINYDYNL